MVCDWARAGAGAGGVLSALHLTELSGGVRFAIHVQPRSKKPGVGGLHGEALKVRVRAAPVDGEANEAVVEALAEAFGVATAKVRLVAGFGSRAKTVEIDGVRKEAVLSTATAVR